ncbi:hypothetical protein Fmac_032896 [Flemingia macrophylla]|uniref:Uncharacterized protein n=1 Tax=Flemingia macrophylla TaxID=520843 RepID=A0ABD1L682_9FABA
MMWLRIHLARNKKAGRQARYSCEFGDRVSRESKPEAYAANTYSGPPQEKRDKPLDREDGSQLLAIQRQEMMPLGVHDVATDTFAENRKLEGKLDALVKLLTQLAANQKPASVARVCRICSSNDHHTRVCPSPQSNMKWMSVLRLMLQTPIAGHHKEER